MTRVTGLMQLLVKRVPVNSCYSRDPFGASSAKAATAAICSANHTAWIVMKSTIPMGCIVLGSKVLRGFKVLCVRLRFSRTMVPLSFAHKGQRFYRNIKSERELSKMLHILIPPKQRGLS